MTCITVRDVSQSERAQEGTVFVTYWNVWEAYCKALSTGDADDWRLYIALSDIYCHA